ncbi:MAG TPA: hypothetical protein PK389_05505 [Gammaproteobacteria bacterium]|nr:hypothetical protein [Gammaproteobacteria bacterium]
METNKKRTGRFGAALLTVCIMGILFGWTAYAEDSPAVDKDVGDVAQKVLTGSPLTEPPPAPPLGISAPPVPPGILDRATHFMEQLSEGVLLLINNNTNSALYGAGIEASKAMVAKHFDRYCAGLETGNCPSDPLLQNGDIKISSILSGTAYDGPARVQAAQDYLTNLFVPPSAPLVANFSGDLKDGKLDVATVVGDPKLLKKYTQALSDETVLSAARQSFAQMMAMRTVSTADAGSISEMQLMEAEGIKRFMSTGWVQMIKDPKTTPAQLQQEMVAMQAYQNWMAYQQFRQLERIEALLATVIVQSARTMQTIGTSLPTAPSAAEINNAATSTGAVPPSPQSAIESSSP